MIQTESFTYDSLYRVLTSSCNGSVNFSASYLANGNINDKWDDGLTTARASGADDVLQQTRVVDSVAAAVADCGLVAATTARERDQNFRVLDVRDAAQRLVQEAQRSPVALLFGPERTGLTNDELAQVHLLLRIPVNPDYLSLNLSMAVQLAAYEIYRARGATYAPLPAETPLASGEEMARLYTHLEEVLREIDFRDRTVSGTSLMARIRRFVQRAELDKNEANIVRGILTHVQRKRRAAGAPR